MNHSLGRAIFGLATRAKRAGNFSVYAEALAERELLPTPQLHEHIGRKLERILNHATLSTEHYSAFRKNSCSDPFELIRHFPILEKQDLREQSVQLLSNSPGRGLFRKTTGGSTGQPVSVWKNGDALAHELAATAAYYKEYGVQIGERAIRLWGAPTTNDRRLRMAIADIATNRRTYSSFAFTEKDLLKYFAEAVRFAPVYAYGYASMLAEFARVVERAGVDGRTLPIRAAIATSEELSPAMREQFQRVFGVKVWNEYGCGEVGPISYECRAGSNHVMIDNLYVEVVSPDGVEVPRGETGRLLITDLNNTAMPLIRYAVGDSVRLTTVSCRCGRNTPVIASIVGREYDYVRTVEGTKYHGEFFLYAFEDLAARGSTVERFQVVQDRVGHISVRLVGAHEALRMEVHRELKRRIPSLDISVNVVEQIERRASGKHAIIIQKAYAPGD